MLGPNELYILEREAFMLSKRWTCSHFQEMTATMLFIRSFTHTQLQDSQEDIGQLLNVSIAWNWSYFGGYSQGACLSLLNQFVRSRILS
jgi:hypothetical protein